MEVQPYRPVCNETFQASEAMKQGIDPYAMPRRIGWSGIVKKAERISKLHPERREFITVKAWKI